MTALTLRDCRRLMSRGRWPMSAEADAVAHAIASSIGWGDEALRAIDRLISRYGADAAAKKVVLGLDEDEYIEVGEYVDQADRTDHQIGEDAPISEGAHDNSDANTHGGDGNSGECEHAAEKTAEDRTGSESACDAGSTGDTPDGRERDAAGDDANSGGTPEPSDSSAKAGQPTDQGETGADEVTEGMGSQPIDIDSPLADDEPEGNRCPAEGDGEGVDGTMRAPQASGDAGAPEADSQDASCGCVVGVTQSLARVAEVARISIALSHLMADAARPEPSPMWDGKRVVRELVTRQVRLHRMRRETPAVKGLLVIYDVSGSCGWIAARTWGIAEALAKRYSSFYAAATPAVEEGAEGSLDPSRIVGRGAYRFAKLPPIVGNRHGDDVAGWSRLKAAGVSHILVFGDAHGTAGYRAAAEAGIRVLWANPNPSIAPSGADWCDYTIIADGDIAAAVETLTRRK